MSTSKSELAEPSLPASSSCVAVTVNSPSARPEAQSPSGTLQEPPEAVAVNSRAGVDDPAAKTFTATSPSSSELPASEGVESLVTDPSAGESTVSAGAAVSTSKSELAEPSLPAASDCVAVTVNSPSPRAEAQSPSGTLQEPPDAVAVNSRAGVDEPAANTFTATSPSSSDVPASSGVASFVTEPSGGDVTVSTGATTSAGSGRQAGLLSLKPGVFVSRVRPPCSGSSM